MIQNLRLVNFRKFKDNKFTFKPGVNIIVGPNACGKTSIIEAILFSLNGKSFRVKDFDLIRIGQEWSKVTITTDKMIRTTKLNKPNREKSIEQDNNIHKRFTESLRYPSVLFEPNNLNLLSSSPETRRTYLDSLIRNIKPEYQKLINQYDKNLLQRNNLLKKMSLPSGDQLFPWNIRLTQLAEKIIKERLSMTESINGNISNYYQRLSGKKEKVSIKYISELDIDRYASEHLKALDNNLSEDLRTGFTRFGPHRDDFSIKFNDNDANGFASRGEVRSAILALKMCEVKITEDANNFKPVLLMDDVFSELDVNRRNALTKIISGLQCFITTTDADIVVKQFHKHCFVIDLGA